MYYGWLLALDVAWVSSGLGLCLGMPSIAELYRALSTKSMPC